jgi:ribA/ribD-fused uncharacterized protein
VFILGLRKKIGLCEAPARSAVIDRLLMFYDSNGGRHSTVNEVGVYGFFGDYRFLSNFEICQFKLDGLSWSSSESAYMACKVDNWYLKEEISKMTPNEAKKVGRSIKLIPDWDLLKVYHMTRILFAKFKQNQFLADKLSRTGNLYLEETNDWNDKFWGRDTFGDGHNMLGSCLMIVRDNI